MASIVSDEMASISNNVHICRYMIIAAVTCLVYDYILTFNDEKRLIWSSHMSTMKIAFFVNRYMPFLGTIGMLHTLVMTNSHGSGYFDICKSRYLVFSGFILVEFIVAAFIIYTRAYAVWGCKRSMLLIISSAYIVLCTLALYFSVHFISSVTVLDYRLFPTGCLLGLHSCHSCLFSMIVLVVSEFFALAMILVKAARMPSSTMMQRISEDGVVYFIIVVCTSIANIVVLAKAPPTLCDFLLATQSALQSICCNHLLFRIKSLSGSHSFKDSARPPSRVQSDAQPFNDIEMTSSGSWAAACSERPSSKLETV